MSIEEFIIAVYCLVEETLQKLGLGSLRRRGFQPALTDGEVITIGVVCEFLGIDTDKGAWEYIRRHWAGWFPRLGSRANFAKHAANLWWVQQQMHAPLAESLGAFSDPLHLADGFPMPVCEFGRAPGSEVYRGEASYGYCPSKKETYYGFKGNLLISSQGVITALTVTAAHVDERESLWEIVRDIQGRVIADKGLIGWEYQQTLKEETRIDLQTAVRDNMTETRSESYVKWLKATRRLVETVIGQLTERFHIERVRARKLWYLTNRLARKVLSHTLCVFLNRQQGNPPLQLDRLVRS